VIYDSNILKNGREGILVMASANEVAITFLSSALYARTFETTVPPPGVEYAESCMHNVQVKKLLCAPRT
jgi:hypothetical protein